MYRDEPFLQSLHESYSEIYYSEEQRPLPMDRMKRRADQYDSEARGYDRSARAWGQVESDRNKGLKGAARRVGRKFAGPSKSDLFIKLKKAQDKLSAGIARNKRDTINTVGDMRMQSPSAFEQRNRQVSSDNRARGSKNNIRRMRLNREDYEYLLDCLVGEGYADDYETAANIAESMSDGWITSYFEG